MLLLVVALAGCEKEPEDTGDDRFVGVSEALQADLADTSAGAISLAIWDGGEIVFAEAWGTTHPDGDTPVDTDTLFQIGSITKQMTALTVLQKVEEGALSLDDTLAETVPDLVFVADATWSQQITLHQQLSHQTGMADHIPWTEEDPTDATLHDYATTTFAGDAYPMNPPGTFWNYSNPNFCLAGLAVEGVDERAWPDVIEQDVFAPLGMERTFARKAPVVEDGNFAVGHGLVFLPNGNARFGILEMDAVTDFGWIRPAGLVWSTPSDLLRWADFLMHGDPDVLSDALRAEITTPHIATVLGPEGFDPAYGYGMFVIDGYALRTADTFYDEPMWTHGGNTLSHTAGLYILPERDYAVAWVASGYGQSFTESVARALEASGVDTPMADPPDYPFDPARLDDHVGTYDDPHRWGEMIVTREGDVLSVVMPDLVSENIPYQHELEAISDTIFVITIQGFQYDLTFFGEPGTPSSYVRNRSFVFEREAPAARRAPIKVRVPPSTPPFFPGLPR